MSDCKHEELEYCSCCGQVRCKKCGQVWGNGQTTYPIIYPLYPTYPIVTWHYENPTYGTNTSGRVYSNN